MSLKHRDETGNEAKEANVEILHDGLYVRETGPKDFFDSYTVPVGMWLKNVREVEGYYSGGEELFNRAVAALAKHTWWDWELRLPPQVGWDFVSDDVYFIFKSDNNGTTFFVSQRDFRELVE